MNETYFTSKEQEQFPVMYRQLIEWVDNIIAPSDRHAIKELIKKGIENNHYQRDIYGINPVLHNLQTALILCEKVSADRNMVLAVLLNNLRKEEFLSNDALNKRWGGDVAKLVNGLLNVSTLYSKQAAVHSENFRKLLLTFAEDIRVIIIMIADRVALMRTINHHENDKYVQEVSYEALYLYAPLAHRLGLYAMKSELEDLSMKYTEREIYTQIAHKLNETKRKRDAYITNFIGPVKEKLEAAGLKFDIKGRTKSISSIWNKMKKQHNDLENIYDLFAIRVILDSAPENEKRDCWTAFSIITDMYVPNPTRTKDWLTIPKSNGYESLHTTVSGPDDKWVEVQIRTRRMDEIAEKGLAAHWKYKGIKSEANLDTWMNNVRDILEAADNGPMELMRNVKMDVYNKEVFVFTPKGDLYKLPMGASVLDFAFNIHTRIGCQCTGGKVNGTNRKLNYKLKSGDTVEIFTSQNQQPKQDWLNFTVTSKARNKIRATLKEQQSRAAELGKELLQRRFKNRKIELDESMIMKVIKRMGYKMATDFYGKIGSGEIDVNTVFDQYIYIENKAKEEAEKISAEEYVMQPVAQDEANTSNSDILVIGDNIKGINYKLAKCCNPIFGDNVFGFVSGEGVIKIHRTDCPNAANIRKKYPYRLIRTQWSGKVGAQFGATLRIVGYDDIGIVTNITSIITKEKDVILRSISIDSNDGLFQGYVVVGVNDTQSLNRLIKKIKTVKGVKDVERSK